MHYTSLHSENVEEQHCSSRINNKTKEVMNVSEIFIMTSVKVLDVYAMGL